jgi:hypothetical protein
MDSRHGGNCVPRGAMADMTSLPKATLDGLHQTEQFPLSNYLNMYPAEHISTDEHVPYIIVYSDDSTQHAPCPVLVQGRQLGI